MDIPYEHETGCVIFIMPPRDMSLIQGLYVYHVRMTVGRYYRKHRHRVRRTPLGRVV